VNGDVLFLEEFFAPAEVEALREYAMQRELQFVASEVVGGDQEGRQDDDFRRSRVLYDVANAYPLVSERVMQYLPYVVDRLELVPFDVREIELQITASNDGEWFKPHRDSGHGPVATRELTFVYYCHREPRGFSGGELRVFRMFEDGDDPAARGRAQTITPQQNSVVFFPSNVLHEVMPVSCPSRRFSDSRLTYNGWLHR
jgi:Rps23 Pro-64 3,4-dihydroxylase Tpa1-like proline 4-hydroxylase